MFPETSIPHKVTHYRLTQGIRDADDNLTFNKTRMFSDRPARKYRDAGIEATFARQGITVNAMIAFKFHDGDDVRKEDVLELDGQQYDVIYPKRMDLGNRPSHWEIAVRDSE